MKPTTFDWKTGTIVSWGLDDVDETRPLSGQSGHLKEDLAQIRFPDGIVLDLGWYPSFDPDGAFAVTIV